MNGYQGQRIGAGIQASTFSVAPRPLIQILEEVWPEEERGETIRAMVVLANAGNIDAFKLLMAYAYGKPIARTEVRFPDGPPMKVYAGFDPEKV